METTASTRSVRVGDQTVAYREAGSGPAVLFLHGNPTSSYLWRHVLPLVAPVARCLAADLVGMGASSRPAVPYRLADHLATVAGLVDALDLGRVTLVGHDWGAVLALAYTDRHPGRVRGVAFMEGHLHPVDSATDLGEDGRAFFTAARDEVEGRRLVLEENVFVETILPSGVGRPLTAEEMDAYRRPFPTPASREAIRALVREIPIDGQPADVHAMLTDNWAALRRATALPKLLLHARPGAVVGEREVAMCRAELASLEVVDLGEGTHFLPEDHPEAIGRALVAWLARLP